MPAAAILYRGRFCKPCGAKIAHKSSKSLFDHSKKLYKYLTKYLSDEIFVINIAVDDEYFVSADA
ncbi:hypothetical protein CSB88_2092 [Pseudomonas aeruginosa]|nr:hypothetical protein CSB88_2092 [Pseudomonas aeruginosa]